ncbi:MAG: DUF5674 family protein [Candidatus Levyibacteriota bacterium]
MIVTKNSSFTKEEIIQLQEQFDVYIKTVIDMEKKTCSAGCDLHADSEKVLLQEGSSQEDLWGGGINIETKEIDYNSFINIRPQQNNTTIEIQSPEIKQQFDKQMKAFFKELYE